MIDLIVFILFIARSGADLLFDSLKFEAGGMTMTAGAALNLCVLALAAAMFFSRSGSAFPTRIWLPFLTVAAASIAWSPDKPSAFRVLLVFLTQMSFFAFPFYMSNNYRDELVLLKAIIYSSAIPAIAGLVEIALFLDQSGRVKSIFLHPNVFALYLMIVVGVIFFLLSSTIAQFKPWVRRLMLPYSAVLTGLIILTQTRAAWVGTFLIFSAYAVFVNRRFLLAFLLLPGLLFVPAVSNRLADLERGTAYSGHMRSEADAVNSFAWRILMWERALDDLSNAAVFGKGLNAFAPNSLVFFPLVNGNKEYSYRGVGAHNIYVQTVYEVGAIGLICYVYIFGKLFGRIWRYARIDRRGAIALMSVILAFMISSFSDNMFDYGSVNLYFWGFVGIVFAKMERFSNLPSVARTTSLSKARSYIHSIEVGERL